LSSFSFNICSYNINHCYNINKNFNNSYRKYNINSKLNQFLQFIIDNNIHIASLNESKLNTSSLESIKKDIHSSFNSLDFLCHSNNVIETNDERKLSGGVCIIKNSSIFSDFKILNSIEENDLCCVSIQYINVVFHIIFIYIKPNLSSELLMNFLSRLEILICKFNSDCLIIVGDLNARIGSYSFSYNNSDDNIISVFCDNIDECVNNYGKYILELCNKYSLFCINGYKNKSEFTFLKSVDSRSVIDLCFMNIKFLSVFKSFEVISNIFYTEHCPIIVRLSFVFNKNSQLNNKVNNDRIRHSIPSSFQLFNFLASFNYLFHDSISLKFKSYDYSSFISSFNNLFVFNPNIKNKRSNNVSNNSKTNELESFNVELLSIEKKICDSKKSKCEIIDKINHFFISPNSSILSYDDVIH
jgi:hypothetical protein